MDWYAKHYLKSLELQNEALQRAFRKELEFLAQHCVGKLKILEVGSGNGRVIEGISDRLMELEPKKRPHVFIGVDINQELVDLATKEQVRRSLGYYSDDFIQDSSRRRPYGAVHFFCMDGRMVGRDFAEERFNVSFTAYNTLGAIEDIGSVVDAMAYVTRPEGEIINLVWSTEPETTKFLEGYYPALGFKIEELHPEKTILRDEAGEAHVINRPPVRDLVQAYLAAGIRDFSVSNVGRLYTCIVGKKPERG